MRARQDADNLLRRRKSRRFWAQIQVTLDLFQVQKQQPFLQSPEEVLQEPDSPSPTLSRAPFLRFGSSIIPRITTLAPLPLGG